MPVAILFCLLALLAGVMIVITDAGETDYPG